MKTFINKLTPTNFFQAVNNYEMGVRSTNENDFEDKNKKKSNKLANLKHEIIYFLFYLRITNYKSVKSSKVW